MNKTIIFSISSDNQRRIVFHYLNGTTFTQVNVPYDLDALNFDFPKEGVDKIDAMIIPNRESAIGRLKIAQIRSFALRLHNYIYDTDDCNADINIADVLEGDNGYVNGAKAQI